ELVVEQGGEVKDTLGDGDEVVCVHDVNSGIKHLIIKNGNSLYYRLYGETEKKLIKTYESGAFKCSAMGNVLCVYGIGEVEHWLFVDGGYHYISADQYNIPILFGVETELRKRTEAKVPGVLVGGDESTDTYAWENIAIAEITQENRNVVYELKAGTTYRLYIDIVSPAGWQPWVKYELTYTDDSHKSFKSGRTTQYHEFTPEKNVKKIYISTYTSDSFTKDTNTIFSAVVTLDKRAEKLGDNTAKLDYNGTEESVNNALLGAANALIGDIIKDNKFVFPFFVRCGFRLTTGDILTVSPPCLVEPNTGVTPLIELANITSTGTGAYYYSDIIANAYQGKLKYRVKDTNKLKYLLENDKMIESLVIAITDPIYMYKQGATDQELVNSNPAYCTNVKPDNKSYAIEGIKDIPTAESPYYIVLPSFKSYEEQVVKASSFKIVAEIKKGNINTHEVFVDVPIKEGAIENIGGNTSLLPDKVVNLNTYDAQYVFSYNQREHLVGVKENGFLGYDTDTMCGFVEEEADTFGSVPEYPPINYQVGIRNSYSGEIEYIVKGKQERLSKNFRWFFYPNNRASEAELYFPGYYIRYLLKEHPFLNGSYNLGGQGIRIDDIHGDGLVNTKERKTIANDKPNMVHVSAQASPTVIEQTLSVGDGQLLAATSNTVALAQEQFGNSPIYIFSAEGVWVIEVSSDGKYSSRKPVSRDVCINPDSIVQIDNAVLFNTDRGIMLLSGSESICISEAIDSPAAFTTDILPKLGNLPHGAVGIASDIVPFREFLKQSRMLYDYNNQRIIVYNPEQIYAYVYSLKSKQWGMMENHIKYGINSYPECLAVDDENNIVNMSKVELEEGTKDCLIISRPLKLDDGDLLKTIDTIITRGKFRKGAVKTILYGSRDLFSWHLVASSVDHYLRGFRGTPYKYFRIVLACDLQKDESIFGSTIQYTPRLVDKIR
ncbi:MAG: hypothetical protein J6V61_01435, partial [Bacteroidaceae bacterium]|nr:hypothetical protein [Bacteroidaceae bacterium]